LKQFKILQVIATHEASIRPRLPLLQDLEGSNLHAKKYEAYQNMQEI